MHSFYSSFCSGSSLEQTASQNGEALLFAITNIALKVGIGLHLSCATTGSMDASESECKRYMHCKKHTHHPPSASKDGFVLTEILLSLMY